MDEITIGDKTYISSKQAAKITGYAKDYVGQLCREGRVEARLVGRNWYVLDSAIREHRFGREEQEEEPQIKASEEPSDPVSTWQQPQYVAETPVFVPKLEQKVPDAVGSPAIADMQSAWREWFEEKQTTLPDDSGDLKTDLPEVASEAPAADFGAAAPINLGEEVQKEEMVVISRIRHEPEAPVRQESTALEEEEVELHRSYTTINSPRERYEDEVVSTHLVAPAPVSVHRSTSAKERKPGNGVVRALFIVVSLLAALTAVVGTGNAEQLLAGTSLDFGVQKHIIDFLGGTSTYESSL